MKQADVSPDDIRLADSEFLAQVFAEMTPKSAREEAEAWMQEHADMDARAHSRKENGEDLQHGGGKRGKRAIFAAAAMTAIAMTIFAVDTAMVAQNAQLAATAETLSVSLSSITAYAEEISSASQQYHGQYVAKLTEEPLLPEAQEELLLEESERVELLNQNRDYVERVVAAEARGEPFEGMMAVAQVILDRAELWEMTPYEVVTQQSQFAPPYQGAVSEDVKQAVAMVFDEGVRVFDDPVTHFYSGSSTPYWTSNKISRGTVGSHKFWY